MEPLIILALEVMSIEVRNNVDIAGVKIGGHSVNPIQARGVFRDPPKGFCL